MFWCILLCEGLTLILVLPLVCFVLVFGSPQLGGVFIGVLMYEVYMFSCCFYLVGLICFV